MKKRLIVSGLLTLFFAHATVFAAEALSEFGDDQNLDGINLSSNAGKNPFSASSADESEALQADTATTQAGDDSDNW